MILYFWTTYHYSIVTQCVHQTFLIPRAIACTGSEYVCGLPSSIPAS